MPIPMNQILKEFVPESYYELWAFERGINLNHYPYIMMEHDTNLTKRVPFAVYNFYIPKVEDQPVAAAVVIYKSLYSKHQFRKLIYL
jgi:hypothetical protein